MVYVLKRMRPKAALWELSDAEIKEILATRKKIMESAGMKRVAGIYQSFGGERVVVSSYPSLEALQKVREETMSYYQLGHDRYFELTEEILYEVDE